MPENLHQELRTIMLALMGLVSGGGASSIHGEADGVMSLALRDGQGLDSVSDLVRERLKLLMKFY